MPTARWHQGADFAHEVLPKKRFAQPLPPAMARTPSRGVRLTRPLQTSSARRGAE